MVSHPCHLCGRKFASKHYLSRHVLSHSGDGGRYSCQQCDKSYLIASHLADHMRSHSAAYDHLCEVCGRRFKHRKQLRVHAVLHNGTKSYSCDQCPYSASFFSGLARHKKRHAAPDQRPYPCPDCARRFLTLQNLRNHQRRRHSATLLLALAAPDRDPSADPAAAVEEGTETVGDSEDADDPDRPSEEHRGDASDEPLEPDSASSDVAERQATPGFSLALSARHDAFLEDDDTASGSQLLEHVTLTSAAGREEGDPPGDVTGQEEGDAGGQLLTRADSPTAGGSLTERLFAEAGSGVFEAADAGVMVLEVADTGVMVLDERVPMVGIEMELNDQ